MVKRKKLTMRQNQQLELLGLYLDRSFNSSGDSDPLPWDHGPFHFVLKLSRLFRLEQPEILDLHKVQLVVERILRVLRSIDLTRLEKF